jgi:autotransporter-associated beta strand protein
VATAGANTFAGPITLASATKIAATGGSLSLSGAVSMGGFGLTIDGGPITFAGNISGTAGVTKTGSGTATLSGTNTFPSLAVTTGTVKVAGAAGNAIADTGSVTVSPGATFEVAASEAIDSLQPIGGGDGSVVLDSGQTLTVNQGSFTGVISGAGALTKSSGGVLNLSVANTFTGGLTVNGGTVHLQNGAAVADAAPVMVANVIGAVLDVAAPETIGGLSGGGASGGNVTLTGGPLTVGTLGGTYSGVISGGFGLNKTGGADLSLGAANTFTGKVNVSGGGRIGIVTDAGTGRDARRFHRRCRHARQRRPPDQRRQSHAQRQPRITIGAGGGTLRGVNSSLLSIPGKITGSTTLTISTNGSSTTPATVMLGGTTRPSPARPSPTAGSSPWRRTPTSRPPRARW